MGNDIPQLILASGSAGRKMMLDGVGLSYTALPADIDEQAIINSYDGDIQSVTAELARQKAIYISRSYPEALVIGSDQTLEFEGRIFSKSVDMDDAREKLCALRGNMHSLHSAVAVIRGGDVVFQCLESAHLTMHDFDDAFLERYMRADPDALMSCVGGYKIEGAGAWLFSEIRGDHFTIMGMPLLPLLAYLRAEWGGTP